jgi:hypothetical protein
MQQRRFGTLRAIVLASISAASLVLATVSSVFASSGGPSFP